MGNGNFMCLFKFLSISSLSLLSSVLCRSCLFCLFCSILDLWSNKILDQTQEIILVAWTEKMLCQSEKPINPKLNRAKVKRSAIPNIKSQTTSHSATNICCSQTTNFFGSLSLSLNLVEWLNDYSNNKPFIRNSLYLIDNCLFTAH